MSLHHNECPAINGVGCLCDDISAEKARAEIARRNAARLLPVETKSESDARRCRETGYVIRYVVTYINGDGMRTMLSPAQGRNTFSTEQEAADHMSAVTGNNSSDNLAQILGKQAIGTFETRPCKCWPGHFDPKGVWFD